MKIRVWLYKTQWKFKKKYFISQLISIRTFSKYSHIEIEDVDAGLMYTSTMRDEDNGTVVRLSSLVLRHPSHWDCIEFEANETEYSILIWWLNKEVEANMGYGKWDIMRFLSPIHWPDNLRNICSEIVNNACVIIGKIKGFGIPDPAKVAKKFKKLGYKILDGRDVLNPSSASKSE